MQGYLPTRGEVTHPGMQGHPPWDARWQMLQMPDSRCRICKMPQMPMPDAKQMDAFPHIVYWRELPGLVVDGALQAHGARTHATRPPSQQRASAPVLVRERASRTAHLTPSPCLHYACVAPRRFRRFRHRLSLLMEAREARGQGGARLVFRDERARAEAGPHSGRGGRRAA
jgi:hypothetical protein